MEPENTGEELTSLVAGSGTLSPAFNLLSLLSCADLILKQAFCTLWERWLKPFGLCNEKFCLNTT